MAERNINETNSRCEVNESGFDSHGAMPLSRKKPGKASALLLMRGNDHEAKQQ